MIVSRRALLHGLLALPVLRSSLQASVQTRTVPRGEERPFAPEDVERLARVLATRPFQGHRYVTPQWTKLHYEQYQKIRFRPEAALWRGPRSPFEAQLLLPGMLYRNWVDIFLVEDGLAFPLRFSLDLFRSDEPMPALDPAGAGGFSGVRLLSAPHRADGMAEFAVFQGGSYFRAVGKGQEYGLSARGLALNTEGAGEEEFPVFRTFWLETPSEHADFVRLYALLDSRSLTGAYRFEVQPGAHTLIDVEATLFPRTELEKVGVAPLTSMFYFGSTRRPASDDFRSGVHDSDGLMIANGAGEWLWRPLANPAHLQISSFIDADPRGFGLMQRERRFERYGDLVTAYHARPSLWVQPRGRWGEGAVFLVEMPTDTEINDNVVAFWRPRRPWRAGSEQRLVYRLFWGAEAPVESGLAPVVESRLGRNQFGGLTAVIDFGPHPRLAGELSTAQPDVIVGGGHLHRVWMQENPHTGGVRLNFGFGGPEDSSALELRAALRRDNVPLTDVWLYRWTG